MFPNRFNADLILKSKSIRVFDKEGSSSFKDDFLYLSLYSKVDASLLILASFGIKKADQPDTHYKNKRSAYLQIYDSIEEKERKEDKITANFIIRTKAAKSRELFVRQFMLESKRSEAKQRHKNILKE
jgi:hypothetical protein